MSVALMAPPELVGGYPHVRYDNPFVLMVPICRCLNIQKSFPSLSALGRMLYV